MVCCEKTFSCSFAGKPLFYVPFACCDVALGYGIRFLAELLPLSRKRKRRESPEDCGVNVAMETYHSLAADQSSRLVTWFVESPEEGFLFPVSAYDT